MKIDDLNDQIRKWDEVNGVSVIKPDLAFKLGTDEIKATYYRHRAAYLSSALRKLPWVPTVEEQWRAVCESGGIHRFQIKFSSTIQIHLILLLFYTTNRLKRIRVPAYVIGPLLVCRIICILV